MMASVPSSDVVGSSLLTHDSVCCGAGHIQVVLFRRDLRLQDHEPLSRAIEAATRDGLLVPLWVYDPMLLAHESSSTSHYLFIDQCLDALDSQLQALGSGLVYRSGLLTGVLAQLLNLSGGRITLWSHRVTGHSADRARDQQIAAWCELHRVTWNQEPTGGASKTGPNSGSRSLRATATADCALPLQCSYRRCLQESPKGFASR